MDSAKLFEVERLAKEFGAWRAVPGDDRAPAAAWWWSTALALRTETQPLPGDLREAFGLPDGSSYADVAGQLMDAIACQKFLATPTGFPLKPKTRDPALQLGEVGPPSSDRS
ncbi:hypothetical protein LPW26_10525 [Rhodopseudomonas sp. HC1]|uniref:hypothetical protein n=1 Tax=Rhodopseudomonas infernalis TaxID=2897386 RepID=UPI001EE7A027|nr:hypothetical protein [Rhodopseudomonas infernalis]MCG6205073.1 hypothetical protein [Rhodopseudomonas infernalis]